MYSTFEGYQLSTIGIYKHLIIIKQNTKPIFTKSFKLRHSQKGDMKNKYETEVKIDSFQQQEEMDTCNRYKKIN